MLSNKCPYSIASAGHVAFVGGISVRITHPKPAGIPRVTRHKKAGGKSKGLGLGGVGKLVANFRAVSKLPLQAT